MSDEQVPKGLEGRGPGRPRLARWAAAVLAAGAVGAGAAVGVPAATGGGDGSPATAAGTSRSGGAGVGSTQTQDELSVEAIYDRAAAGVVLVRAGGRSGDGGGLGSGFVIDREGRIVTNYHVVAGADSVTVAGGPLLNARTEVIGVNSQIMSRTGGNVGIGCAVPVNTVKDVVRGLVMTARSSGRTSGSHCLRPKLGID